MSCPYTESDLEFFDGVTNPIGKACRECTDFECDHNDNEENPEWDFDGSGSPMTPEEFAKANEKVPKVNT